MNCAPRHERLKPIQQINESDAPQRDYRIVTLPAYNANQHTFTHARSRSMFDAKSLLESLVKGANPQHEAPAQGAGLDLSDLLKSIQGGGADKSSDTGGLGSLGDILGKLQAPGKSDTTGGQASSDEAASNITDAIGSIFSQATQGVKEGAGKINDATGAGDALSDITRQLSQQLAGKSPEEMMSTIQDLIATNKLASGAALGGLGALVLGTSTGRSIAVGAAKIGALALIGGLAYKAYQNYEDGKPVIDGLDATSPPAPPNGSGFEPDAISNEQAALLIRTMIAAAAADGRVDASEHDRVLDGMKQSGIDNRAEEFLASQLNNPASIDDIVQAVKTKEEAIKVYTAARIAIDPDTAGERAFLSQLAAKLGIEPDLARHIDAASRVAPA